MIGRNTADILESHERLASANWQTTPPAETPALAIRPTTPAAAPAEAELLAARDAARMCAVSESTFWRRHSAGEVPAPIKFGGRTLWRRRELLSWIDVGCPDRRTWEATKEGEAFRKGRK